MAFTCGRRGWSSSSRLVADGVRVRLGFCRAQVVGIVQQALELDGEEHVYTSLREVPELMSCLRILSRVRIRAGTHVGNIFAGQREGCAARRRSLVSQSMPANRQAFPRFLERDRSAPKP